MPSKSLWALVVSIEDYACPRPGWKSVAGAHRDAENVTNYLRNDMQVPEDHIRHLKDASASRAEIISAFTDHLIENQDIRRGDAILFYYSGHGCSLKAPAGWTVVEEKAGDEELDNMVEAILPWDEGAKDPTTHLPICAIPDRTLAFLIEKVANLYGNNITVVLDCCSSGHGTRGSKDDDLTFDGKVFVARSVDSESLTPLPGAEVDIHLAPAHVKPTSEHTPSSSSYYEGSRFATTRYNHRALSGIRGTRFKSLASNHVLLAACGPKERALGDSGGGGIFTRWWIDALRKKAVQPCTYAEIVKWVDRRIDIMRAVLDQAYSSLPADERPQWTYLDQHPQCDGVARDKLMFEETMIRADYFEGVFHSQENMNTGGRLEISCGLIHGVDVGSIFQLHQLDKHLQSVALLGTAEVVEAGAMRCIARTQDKIAADVKRCTAIPMREHLQKLNYVIDRKHGTNGPRNLIECRRILARSSFGETGSKNVKEVDAEEDAELKICFESDGTMTLYRLDPLLKSLTNPPPRLNVREVERAEFAEILPGIARFNKLLSLTNVTHGPFVDEVTFEMHHLVRPNNTAGQPESGFVLREKDKLARTEHGEIEVQENEEYAIVLRNTTPQSLFVQVWYFDPDTYEILDAYQPVNDTKPNLPPNGTLQIGASSEVSEPLEFFLPKGASRNTLFAKVFVTDSFTKLTLLHQGALIGEDWRGFSNILNEQKDEYDDRADNKTDVQTTSMWNTILQKITVVSRQK